MVICLENCPAHHNCKIMLKNRMTGQGSSNIRTASEF